MAHSFNELAKLAETGQMPEGFTSWWMASITGFSLAHIAARHGHLPKNFIE